VFENRVLRRIFGNKRGQVAGQWRRLHIGDLHSTRIGEGRNVYRVLVGKAEGERPLGRPRRRWEDGISLDPREIDCGECGLDSPGSGYEPLAGCRECGDEPSGSGATEFYFNSVSVLLFEAVFCYP
jgi:hypothetical protein